MIMMVFDKKQRNKWKESDKGRKEDTEIGNKEDEENKNKKNKEEIKWFQTGTKV